MRIFFATHACSEKKVLAAQRMACCGKKKVLLQIKESKDQESEDRDVYDDRQVLFQLPALNRFQGLVTKFLNTLFALCLSSRLKESCASLVFCIIP